MASLRQVSRFRYLVLLWSVAESLLLSAIIYGWASLVVVLKEENFFSDLCPRDREFEVNSTRAFDGCVEQDERLNLVFTVGVFTFSSCGVFAGTFLDYFGPRKTRWLSCFLFSLCCLFFSFSDKERPNFIFPGIITLASAGLTMFLTVIQVANMFSKWKSSVISLFNGALDSSAIVLLLFKLVYDGGVPLKWIFLAFFLFAIVSMLAFTFVLPPYMITTERLEVLDKDAVLEIPHANGDTLKDDEPLVKSERQRVNGEQKSTGKIGEGKQKHRDLQEAPLCDEEEFDLVGDDVATSAPEFLNAAPIRLFKIVKTPEHMLLVMYISICTLRLWFYVGSLNSYLDHMSHNDIGTVNQYTNWFGITQFAGCIFAPVVGFVMDWKPKSKKNKDTDIGFVVGFFLTGFVALLLNILVLIPILHVQYISFVVQVILRAFAYATYASFVLHKFPMAHYGKLFGIGQVIAAICGCLQYPLFILNESSLKKDPFWINVGFLVLCLLLFVFPAYLWFKESKRDRNEITVSNNHTNIRLGILPAKSRVLIG